MTIYYHACGKLKHDLAMDQTGLVGFERDHHLFVTQYRAVAEWYASNFYGLDQLVLNLVLNLDLAQISGLDPFNLAFQLRGYLSPEGITLRKAVSRLSAVFPISGKVFRKAILEIQDEMRKYPVYNYVFRLELDGENIGIQAFFDDSLSGIGIPLSGPGRTKSAVELDVPYFLKRGCDLYERDVKKVPALSLEGKVVSVEQSVCQEKDFFPVNTNYE